MVLGCGDLSSVMVVVVRHHSPERFSSERRVFAIREVCEIATSLSPILDESLMTRGCNIIIRYRYGRS